jgi:hypothetical protein
LKVSKLTFARWCDYYSLVADESTDITSTAQMCIFAHDVTCDSEALEGLLSLPSMPGQTKGSNSIQALLGNLQMHNLEPHKLMGTDIDVAISTTGSRIVGNAAFQAYCHVSE